MTTPDETAQDKAAAGDETAVLALAPALEPAPRLSIEQQAAAAVEATRSEREVDPETEAALQSAAADEMTATAMRAPADVPLAPPFAAALSEASHCADMSVLGAVWKVYQECRSVTKDECTALLDEWEDAAWEATHRPLLKWLDAGLTGMAAPAYVA